MREVVTEEVVIGGGVDGLRRQLQFRPSKEQWTRR